jgi:UDP-N-acetylglucosamine transferase subunit ALG13
MIFVTVGTQLPFDRMVRTVDAWAGRCGADVFAQIGPGRYVPRHMQWTRTLPADECNARIRQARAVVAHAGMGSILTALELGKPILVMPRCASLGEHRNDHQLTTAKHFQEQGRIRVGFDEAELEQQLDALATLQPSARIASLASPALIDALRGFVRRAAVRAFPSSQQGPASEPMADTEVVRV